MTVINIDTIGENMPALPSFLRNTQTALKSAAQNKIGGAISRIGNPILRGAAGQLLDNLVPGIGGSTPGFDNAFRDQFNNRIETEVANITAQAATIQVQTIQDTDGALSQPFDWRARLRPKNGGVETFYSDIGVNGDHLLSPLQRTNGIVWQYTPTIFMSGSAEYNETIMQGMNYPINTFISSRPPDIPITADFSANDIYEARYLLAIMTFLKICTKASFGDDAVARGTAGTPPPVLLFEYLGDHGFNKVPVVVTNWSMQLPDNVDYVPVVVNQQVTYVPTLTNIMINLKPQYTPHKLRRKFSVEAVTNGIAYKDGFI
jgi:hypothetical protein